MRKHTAITDIRMPAECKDMLTRYGYNLISLPPSNRLSAPVASHPDMLLNISDEYIVCHESYYSENTALINRISDLSGLRIRRSHELWDAEYPHDVLFNTVRINDTLICGKYCSGLIERPEERILTVNQGYTSCSTCVAGENAIITADTGIAHIASDNGIDVLQITPGNVTLPGYNYGFIGGASGYDGSTVFFCGDITLHPDGGRITEFCNSHGSDVVSLSGDILYDTGKILFV